MTEIDNTTEQRLAQESHSIKLAFAECLLQWAQVEWFLSVILQRTLAPGVLIQPPHGMIGFTIWSNIVNFESRLKTLNAILLSRIQLADLKKIWLGLYTRVSKRSRRRNKIAHASLMRYQTADKINFFLIPYSSPANPKEEKLTANCIREITASFQEMCIALDWLTESLSVDLAQLEERLKQAPELILRIHQSKNPNLEGEEQPSED